MTTYSISDAFSPTINLCVGGQNYSTTQETLTFVPNSQLANWFQFDNINSSSNSNNNNNKIIISSSNVAVGGSGGTKLDIDNKVCGDGVVGDIVFVKMCACLGCFSI